MWTKYVVILHKFDRPHLFRPSREGRNKFDIIDVRATAGVQLAGAEKHLKLTRLHLIPWWMVLKVLGDKKNLMASTVLL